MNTDNAFFHLEAGEHMITGETKRHKLALMVACTITTAMCILNSSEVTSLFGILKVEPGIPVLKLIPFALAITIYQAILYKHHYKEAINEWNNKIDKRKQDRDFRHFNKLTSYTIKISDAITEKENLITPSSTHSTGLSRLKCFVESYPQIISKEQLEREYSSSQQNIKTSYIESQSKRLVNNLRHISQSLKEIKDIKNASGHPLFYGDSIYEASDISEELFRLANYDFLLINKAHKINSTFDDLEKIIESLDRTHIRDYNQYQIKYYEQQYELDKKLQKCIEQRERAIQNMKRTSFDIKSTERFYKWIPLSFFCFTIFLSFIAIMFPTIPPMILDLVVPSNCIVNDVKAI
ncbi:hypothetical protein ACED63_13335 [Vibrio splendidus]|uniref:hypothetical protein n=1 Tax=Vibrio splendidus TaxID=29497 RepID=UPI00352BD309